MDCIFCHSISDNSKSIEHIIPESLGNKESTLWRGAVCDKCNNYFAIKIEKELLSQPYFISLRYRNFILTKKSRNVQDKVLFCHPSGVNQANTEICIVNDKLVLSFAVDDQITKYLKEGKVKEVVSPIYLEPEPNNYTLSRFLTKCALEFFLFRMEMKNATELSKVLKEAQYNSIRKYARYGKGCKFWHYHQRRIYGEGDHFRGMQGGITYEILNEMDFLCIKSGEETISGQLIIYTELYFVLVIMGIEYVIDMSCPEIDGYELWLKNNNSKSQVERYNEQRIPNTNPQTLQITEELVSKLKKIKYD